MPKKKKKSRANTVEELSSPEPASCSSTNNTVSVVDLISLNIVKSSSPPVKSLKYAPTILLNEADSDHLDVITGDQVFLLSTTTCEEQSSSSTLKLIHTAIAQVHVVTNHKSSPVKSPLGTKTNVRSKLTPGNCHIFPVSLAEAFLGPLLLSEPTMTTTETPATPPVIAKTPPTSKTTTATTLASKSKFSFARGGGGDRLISTTTPTKDAVTPIRTTTTPRSSPASSRNKLWVVPFESSLGDRIASILCRNASSVSIMDLLPDNVMSGPLGKRLILAHIVGSYLGKSTSFSLSFQGKSTNAKVCDIKGETTKPPDDEDVVVLQEMAQLSLDTDGDKAKLLEALKRTHEEKNNSHLQLFKISHHTKICAGDIVLEEQEERMPPKKIVAGLDSTLVRVQSLISITFSHPTLFQSNRHIRPPKGILLHGPSGCGKSSIALQIAQNMQSTVHVEQIHCTSLQSQTALVGQAERRLVELFQSAQRPRPGKAGSLLILDDVHLICPRRQGMDLGADRLSATLLALLDGLDDTSSSASNTRMAILAITSTPSLLDPALRRPGRIDSEVEVPLPDEPSTRSTILQFQLESLGAKADISSPTEWLSLSRLAKGFTGADLQLAVKEALRKSLLHSEVPYSSGVIDVSKKDLEKAIRETNPSAIKAVTVEIPQVHWSSIGGMEDVKLQLREAIELPLTHGHMLHKLGIRPPRGVLLYGPPGCSKTLMARALATEGHMNFLAVKGPELLSKWLGESERALASLFRRARLASPSVIFFDEVDAIASKRGGSSTGGERLLSQLLTELDGIHSRDDASKKRRVVVVCATNRPDLLDSALMRPGRIDRMIHVGVPDEGSRRRIIQITLEGKSCSDDIDVSGMMLIEFQLRFRANIQKTIV